MRLSPIHIHNHPRLIAMAALSLVPMCTLTAQADDLEEVVVIGEGVGNMRLDASTQSGSRLGLSSLQTPASLDLVTDEEIASKGDYDALLSLTRVTGFSAAANPGNGDTGVSARGFNGPNSIVSMYDGMRLYVTAGTVTFPADTGTLERIEVLRGAGSVINGIGAIGASVNYVPKKPKPGVTSLEGLAAVGGFNFKRAALGGGMDLSDNWAMRLDGVTQRSDTQVDRASKQRDALAGSLLYSPNDTFNLRFSVDYSGVHNDSPYFGTPLVNGEASDALRKQNYNFSDGFADYEDIWARMHLEWTINDNITLRNDTYRLTAKREWQNLENYSYNTSTQLIDRDGESYFGIKHDQQQLGSRTELLIESNLAGLKNRFTGGAEINGVDLDYHNNWSQNQFYAGNSVPVLGWQPDTLADANIPTVKAFTTRTRQVGVFFDDMLQLTPQWSALLGVRHDQIRFDRTNWALGGNPQTSFSTDYSAWGGRAGVVFQPISNMSWYAQYSRATDPVTSPVTMSSGNKDFDPTRARQIEIGLKQQLMDNRAEYTLAWFDIVKTGLVVQEVGSPFSVQIGKQRSRGVEATLRINPLTTLSADFNATWVKARYDDFFPFTGNVPNNVPKTTANAWLNWAPFKSWSVGGGWRYVGERFGDDNNSRTLPSYGVFDARASWRASKQLQFDVRGRNLTNARNFILSEYAPSQWLFGEPRTWEVGIRYSL